MELALAVQISVLLLMIGDLASQMFAGVAVKSLSKMALASHVLMGQDLMRMEDNAFQTRARREKNCSLMVLARLKPNKKWKQLL